jgi:hypothetical protein
MTIPSRFSANQAKGNAEPHEQGHVVQELVGDVDDAFVDDASPPHSAPDPTLSQRGDPERHGDDQKRHERSPFFVCHQKPIGP